MNSSKNESFFCAFMWCSPNCQTTKTMRHGVQCNQPPKIINQNNVPPPEMKHHPWPPLQLSTSYTPPAEVNQARQKTINYPKQAHFDKNIRYKILRQYQRQTQGRCQKSVRFRNCVQVCKFWAWKNAQIMSSQLPFLPPVFGGLNNTSARYIFGEVRCIL